MVSNWNIIQEIQQNMTFIKLNIFNLLIFILLITSTYTSIIQQNAATPAVATQLAATTKTKTVTTAAPCISRSTIMTRAQDWVTKKVPYSQKATHDGYRTDCSGFVSMAWKIGKPGLTTATMKQVSHNITKNDLQPGDAMNCESVHIVIFGGWTNSSKTHYTALSESSPALGGTIKRVTPYPYFNKVTCYHPIRYNKVC